MNVSLKVPTNDDSLNTEKIYVNRLPGGINACFGPVSADDFQQKVQNSKRINYNTSISILLGRISTRKKFEEEYYHTVLNFFKLANDF